MNLRSTIATAPAILAALLFLVNCGAEPAPGPVACTPTNAATGGSGGGGGAGAGGSSVGGGAGEALPPTFATVKSIVVMSCFGTACHDLPENPLQLPKDDSLFQKLTTHQTRACGPMVKPCAPQESALVKLLKGPCGPDPMTQIPRMPYGMCLEDGQPGCIQGPALAAIEQWIAAGAKKD